MWQLGVAIVRPFCWLLVVNGAVNLPFSAKVTKNHGLGCTALMTEQLNSTLF